MLDRKVTAEEVMADIDYDIKKKIAEAGEDWVEEAKSKEPIDMELLEPEFEKEALCPCDYGICDEKGACPLYK